MTTKKCKTCGAKLNRIGECSAIVGPCNADVGIRRRNSIRCSDGHVIHIQTNDLAQ